MNVRPEKIMCVNSWNGARSIIDRAINVGLAINTGRSRYRKVLKKDHGAFRVQKGSSSYNHVTYDRLETCWNELHCNGEFDSQTFDKHFAKDRRSSTCWTGVIGEIFVKAGLATRIQDWPLLYKEVGS